MSLHPTYPSWDLSGLYPSPTDPAIHATIDAAKKAATAFRATYQPALSQGNAEASLVARALDEYEALLQPIVKLSSYAGLVFAEDTSKPGAGAFMQKISMEFEVVNQEVLFFDLALQSLPEATFDALLNNPLLAKRRHYLTLLKEQKSYRLSEAEEKILSEKSQTGREAFSRFFQEEVSALRFAIPGKPEPVNESTALHELYSPDREVRRQVSDVLSQGFAQEKRRFAFIYNMLLLDKKSEDRLRKFANPEASRHLANQTTQPVVDALAQAVTSSFSLVEKYYNFKKRVLGLDELFEYDRYAPVLDASHIYTFEEARDLILDAFGKFDPEFARITKRFFDEGWIDATARPGKRGGAFCSFTTPDHHPYVFVNFNGSAKEVMTLAHELGHGVHAYLAREQSLLDFHAPLTVCETASIFGEMLVFESLKKQSLSDTNEHLALLMQKIEEMIATVFRQISMHRFEQKVHDKVKLEGELAPETFDALWLETQREMFGSSVTLRDSYAHWWEYISHFMEVPFYVYAYAFGELLTLSVYEQYRQEGEGMKERYFAFLKAGGSKKPEELVKDLGFDLNDPAFWRQGLHMIGKLIEEAVTLFEANGIKK